MARGVVKQSGRALSFPLHGGTYSGAATFLVMTQHRIAALPSQPAEPPEPPVQDPQPYKDPVEPPPGDPQPDRPMHDPVTPDRDRPRS